VLTIKTLTLLFKVTGNCKAKLNALIFSKLKKLAKELVSK